MAYSVQTQLWPFKFCKFISSVLAISKQCPCPYLKTHWRSSQLKRTKFGPLMVSFTRCKLFRVVSLCVYKQHVLYVPFPLLEVKSQPLQKRRREKHVKTWPFLALATGEKCMGVLQGNMFSLHIIINKSGCVIQPKIPTKFGLEPRSSEEEKTISFL